MSFNRQMVKQTVVYPYHRIQFSNLKKWTIDTHHNLDGSQGNYDEGKKSVLRSYMHDSTYNNIHEMTKLKNQLHRSGKQIKGCHGLKME
jgi:hypothetical protein